MPLIDPWREKRCPLKWRDHENLWVIAANSLPLFERYAAFRDIAAMTGYDYERILDKSRKIRHAHKRYLSIAAE